MPTLIWLDHTVIDEMKDDADRCYINETGGAFMGYWANNENCVVTKMIPAGPLAHHSRFSFEPDQDWQLDQIAEHYKNSQRQEIYLGDWHSHPDTTAVQLSQADKACLKAIIKAPKARQPTPIMLILYGRKNSWIVEAKTASLTRRLKLFDNVTIKDAVIRFYDSSP
jgi:integrative and conjugative element protein (TIGR02256 family)